MGSRRDPLAIENRLAAAVVVQMISAPRRPLLLSQLASPGSRCRWDSRWRNAATLSVLRLHMRTLAIALASIIAARCVFACTPLPSMANDFASERASNRVATPLTAAVRIAVIALASMIARELAV